MIFTSPTKGKMTLKEVFQDIIGYIRENPREQHKLIIGTDSQTHLNDEVIFVTAIIITVLAKVDGTFSIARNNTLYRA